MGLEIERKFLVAELPSGLEEHGTTPIEQGYLATGDDEVRLRRKGDAVFLTVKRGAGMTRTEAEIELTQEQFDLLWPLTAGRRVVKSRTALRHGELTVEVDVFAGALAGLVTAEVEFGDEARARAFEPPGWFGRELTGDPEYGNKSLATAVGYDPRTGPRSGPDG